jgi:hypothetical protein
MENGMSKSAILASYWKDNEKIDITVKDYEVLLKGKNKHEIGTMIYYRFHERYIKPFNYPSAEYEKFYKNGFAMMASGCLLIETLESFYNGWETTEGTGDKTFKSFFQKTKSLKIFENMKFYTHIRCGILHQAETTGGYEISRKGPLFDNKNRVINATKFIEELKCCLGNYRDELKKSEWHSEIWDNFRRKMRSIIRDCDAR